MKRRQFLKSLMGFALAVPVMAKEERKQEILDLDCTMMKHGFMSRNEFRSRYGLKEIAFADSPIVHIDPIPGIGEKITVKFLSKP